MLIDPQSPTSELTVRAEIALRFVQANAAMAGSNGQYTLTEPVLERSIKAADKFIQMLNHDPDLEDSEEEIFEFARQYYL